MNFSSLELWCANLPDLHAFYAQLLGLPVVESSPERLTLQVGQSRLTFHQAAKTVAGRHHLAFDIPENQFDAAFAWLKIRVTPAAGADGRIIFDFTHWNATSVYFWDPAGNILELIARHNQPNAAHEDFSAASLVSISEFGVALEDVRLSVQEVMGKLGVSVYDGAGSDTFSAVGDEQGLLIMVKRGREWMPNAGFPAEFYPFILQVKTQSGQVYTLSAPPFPFVIRSADNAEFKD